MLVKGSILLTEAKRNNYAIGAFNIFNGEFIQAVAEASLEEKSPVIIQVTWDVLEQFGVDYIAKLVKAVIEDVHIPISLHLDHGHNLIQILQCIKAGFTSVMYDGSDSGLEDNISSTREICGIAHDLGVSVEAQLGHIKSSGEDKAGEKENYGQTDPAEAKRFVEETCVDAISISAGSVHGKVDGKAKLRVDLIKEISETIDIPLVLHGGTGISEDDVKEAIKLGVAKINVGTVVRNVYKTEMIKLLTSKPDIPMNDLLMNSKNAMKKVIKEKIRLFGSSGNA